jgi:hypothetical protein
VVKTVDPVKVRIRGAHRCHRNTRRCRRCRIRRTTPLKTWCQSGNRTDC